MWRCVMLTAHFILLFRCKLVNPEMQTLIFNFFHLTISIWSRKVLRRIETSCLSGSVFDRISLTSLVATQMKLRTNYFIMILAKETNKFEKALTMLAEQTYICSLHGLTLVWKRMALLRERKGNLFALFARIISLKGMKSSLEYLTFPTANNPM